MNWRMDLKKAKLYKAIATGSRSKILKVAREFFKADKDPNLRDSDTGGSLLHHIVSHCDKFTDPEMMSVVYMLGLMDIELDTQDHNGDTALHCVVRQKGAYRIMVALIRFGINTSLQNSIGRTAEDILRVDKPAGQDEMLHWYNKFKPGLWVALMDEKPDRELIERLLKSWCRLTTVKNGKVVNMKYLAVQDIYKSRMIRLLDKHDHTNELALTLLAGLGSFAHTMIEEGLLKKANVNASDFSHQIRYPDYPEAPQPLLAATWETNSLDAVDVLMDLKPDMKVLYAPDKDLIPNPVIFRLLSSPYRPKELCAIHRILECADMSIKTHTGQTLLFQAIYTEEPLSTINLLLDKGVNISARDSVGRTARDFAEAHARKKYVKVIDSFVIKAIKNKDFPLVERLLLEGYDHVTNISDASGKTSVDIAGKHSSPQVFEIVRLGAEIQLFVKRLFQAIDDGNHDNLNKLLACKKYAAGRDICGRTPLMKAVLHKRRSMVLKLVTECTFTINLQDSLGRTVLHYAYLFMDDPEMIILLQRCGARTDLTDACGRIPRDYSKLSCGVDEHARLQREVLDADLDIYTYRTDFENSFRAAIKEADLPLVQHLIAGLSRHGETGRYSHYLFECVDLCREDIAIFLLKSGFRTDIWRQNPLCISQIPVCASRECGHSMVSLKQRAVETGCTRVSKLINALTVDTVS